jgi:hypothetical protein
MVYRGCHCIYQLFHELFIPYDIWKIAARRLRGFLHPLFLLAHFRIVGRILLGNLSTFVRFLGGLHGRLPKKSGLLPVFEKKSGREKWAKSGRKWLKSA